MEKSQARFDFIFADPLPIEQALGVFRARTWTHRSMHMLMKTAFWILTLTVAVLLGITVSETHQLARAYDELDRSMQANASVTAQLLKKQKQSLAAVVPNAPSALPERP